MILLSVISVIIYLGDDYMKKLLISLLVLLSVFTLVGCSVKKKSNVKPKDPEEAETEGNIKVGDEKVSLTEKGSFELLHFMYPKRTVVSSLGTYTILVFPKKDSDSTLFRVPISKFYNQKVEDGLQGFTKTGEKTYNGVTWTIFSDDKGQHSYATLYDRDLYVVGFVGDIDLKEYEEAFMNTTSFEK
jgi:hypothetical protein